MTNFSREKNQSLHISQIKGCLLGVKVAESSFCDESDSLVPFITRGMARMLDVLPMIVPFCVSSNINGLSISDGDGPNNQCFCDWPCWSSGNITPGVGLDDRRWGIINGLKSDEDDGRLILDGF